MNIPFIGSKVKHLRQKFSQSVGLPIQDALPESTIEQVIKAAGYKYRQCVFDPILTIWAFLSQTLDCDRSCRKAISRVMAYQADLSDKPFDAGRLSVTHSDTGAYCKARQRLPESVLKCLYQTVSQQLEKGVDQTRLMNDNYISRLTTIKIPGIINRS